MFPADLLRLEGTPMPVWLSPAMLHPLCASQDRLGAQPREILFDFADLFIAPLADSVTKGLVV
jgi:hypothetical protein